MPPRTYWSARIAETKEKETAGEAKDEPKPKAPLPTLEEAMAWEGLRIDGLGNKTLGRIPGIHVNAEEGEPRWALIRLGPLAVPAEDLDT